MRVLVLIHIVMSLLVSVCGPVHLKSGYGQSIVMTMAAYILSFAVNVCGFWPIALGLILFGT